MTTLIHINERKISFLLFCTEGFLCFCCSAQLQSWTPYILELLIIYFTDLYIIILVYRIRQDKWVIMVKPSSQKSQRITVAITVKENWCISQMLVPLSFLSPCSPQCFFTRLNGLVANASLCIICYSKEQNGTLEICTITQRPSGHRDKQ